MAKNKCRTLSLRGVVSCTDNNRNVDHEIFNYESPARDTGWRITGAWLWPKTVEGNTSGDHQYTVISALATDTIRFWTEMDASDNRQCGWLYTGYYARADNTAEMLVPIGTSLPQQRFLIDPDTVVTNALYIDLATLAEHTQAVVREFNYLVTLESMPILPAESILQQLKGIGQDIDQ